MKKGTANVSFFLDLNLSKKVIFILSNHTLFFTSCTSFCHLHPQIAKARQDGRRGKVNI